MTTTYNGWTNYETWDVALWLGDEEPSYRYWIQASEECWEEAAACDAFTREERAVYNLAERLKTDDDTRIEEMRRAALSAGGLDKKEKKPGFFDRFFKRKGKAKD